MGGDIPAGAFEFSFNKLLIGKVEQEGVPVTADLSAVPQNAPTENHDINGLSASDISLYETMHDYDFLVPQGTLWQSEDGNVTLTAAAWYDGALHLSYRTEGKLSRDNHANFAVLRMTDGTELWRDYDVSYVDSDADAEVTEYVFPMAYEDVAGCTLTGDIYTAITQHEDISDGYVLMFYPFYPFSSLNARTQRIDHRISAAVRQPSGRAYAGGRAFGYPRRHQTAKAARTTDFPAADWQP